VNAGAPSGTRRLTNVVGFDDGPFDRILPGARTPAGARGRTGARVLLVGAVCARTRLDGVISGHVRQDGTDATARVAALVRGSQFDGHVRAVLLNGIAFGGFNVVDIHALAAALARPVLVVARRAPRLSLIRLSAREARELLAATTLHGNLPEPLRLAHLIAGGITTGKSRGRA